MSWWLYRTYAGDKLLYVGVTGQGMLRMAEHQRRGSHWISAFSHIEIERYDSEEEALEAERHVIRDERPRDNVVHARSRMQPPTPPGFPPWDALDENVRAHALDYLDDALGEAA